MNDKAQAVAEFNARRTTRPTQALTWPAYWNHDALGWYEDRALTYEEATERQPEQESTPMTEVSVKYVEDEGFRPAVCVRGHKFASCIVSDATTIRVLRVELRDFDKYRPVMHNGSPYPPLKATERLAKYMTRKVARYEATIKARDLIKRILAGDIAIDDDTHDATPTPAPTPTRDTPKAARTKHTVSGERSGGDLQAICAELGIAPTAARRRLRAAGMSAPYNDAAAIRKVLGS